ncbi:MAG TPA: SO2930 family diheme c-type cytochrome [Candidatus Nanopelagicales bacterium]|nr:SO2930 family diheme c-type cytochrome [Candidatus Nanopelagicales bacterium]
MLRSERVALLLAVVGVGVGVGTGAVACGGGEATPAPSVTAAPPAPPEPPAPPKEMPYETLSEYGFFEGPLVEQRPAAGVVPYEVASPLWADHAGKGRFLVLPEGGRARLGPLEEWELPVGTIVIKTFYFSRDLREPEGAARVLETRLLILEDSGWTPHTYVWNEEQTEATRGVAGARVQVDYVDAAGAPATTEYLVPNNNQCKSCHERDDATTLLGLVTPQLNREVDTPSGRKNQLEHLASLGVFEGEIGAPGDLPALVDPMGDAPLDARARSYLHANCSHCHRPGGGGGPSGLVLLEWERDPLHNGVCKGSVAAGQGTGGHDHDIVPGHPEQSIMIFRMGSTDPDIKMPELPNRIPDQAGIELVSAWIAAMEPPGCGEVP